MSSYSHTCKATFLPARYPQRHGPSSRGTNSVGFNSRANRRQRVRTDKEVGKKIFSLARATDLSSLFYLPFFSRDLLIPPNGTPAIPPWKYDPAWIAGQWGACARARTLWTRESRSNSIRSSEEPHGALLLDEGTRIYERESCRRSATKRREMWATEDLVLIAGRRRKTATRGWIAAYVLQASGSHPRRRYPKTATTCPHWWWVPDRVIRAVYHWRSNFVHCLEKLMLD